MESDGKAARSGQTLRRLALRARSLLAATAGSSIGVGGLALALLSAALSLVTLALVVQWRLGWGWGTRATEGEKWWEVDEEYFCRQHGAAPLGATGNLRSRRHDANQSGLDAGSHLPGAAGPLSSLGPLPLAALGCAALCLLPVEMLPREGHSLVCIELSGGNRAGRGAAEAPAVANKRCGWLEQMNDIRRSRAQTILELVRAAAPPGVQGLVIAETHDGTTVPPAFVAQLAQLGIPVLTFSAPKGTAVRGLEELWEPRRRNLILIPDVYFLQSAGYVQMRHEVTQISTKIPWATKRPQAVWRGTSTGPIMPNATLAGLQVNPRVALALLAKRSGGTMDVGFTEVLQNTEEVTRAITAMELVKPHLGWPDMLRARAIFDVDGNSNSWDGCFWKLLGNSVVLKVDGMFEQWYYDQLEPWKHFIPVKPDLSDVEDRVRYALDAANDAELQAIAARATAVVERLTYEGEVRRLRSILEQVLPGLRGPPSETPAAATAESAALATLSQALRADTAARGSLAALVACTAPDRTAVNWRSHK